MPKNDAEEMQLGEEAVTKGWATTAQSLEECLGLGLAREARCGKSGPARTRKYRDSGCKVLVLPPLTRGVQSTKMPRKTSTLL